MKHHATYKLEYDLPSTASCVDCDWTSEGHFLLVELLTVQHNNKDVEFVHRVQIDAGKSVAGTESWSWWANCLDTKCEWYMQFDPKEFSQVFDRAYVHSHRMNRAQNVLRTA